MSNPYLRLIIDYKFSLRRAGFIRCPVCEGMGNLAYRFTYVIRECYICGGKGLMTAYLNIRRFAPGMARIQHIIRGEESWVRLNSGTRKQHRCAICAKDIPVGQPAWRPGLESVNKSHRSHRICDPCMEKRAPYHDPST